MAERRADGRHLILYDGDCGFCARAVAFVPARDGRRQFRFAPLLSEEGRGALAQSAGGQEGSDSLVVIPGGPEAGKLVLRKSAAVLFIAGLLDPPWNLLSACRRLPARWLDRAYDCIARHRHLLSGSPRECPLPPGSAR